MTNQRHVPESKRSQVEKLLVLIMLPRERWRKVRQSQIPSFTFFGSCRFSRPECDTNKVRPEPSPYRHQPTKMPLLAYPRAKPQTVASDPNGWWEDEQSLFQSPRDDPPVSRQCPDERQKWQHYHLQEGVNTEVLGTFHPQAASMIWRWWNRLRFIEPI